MINLKNGAVLFDLDGTLVDTAPDFISVLNFMRNEAGLTEISSDSIRNTVSNGARALITLGFELDEASIEFKYYHARLLDLYLENIANKSKLFSGMEPLLGWLREKGIPWGIVTNKPRKFTVPLIEKLGLHCNAIVCPDDVLQTKPHPEALHLACKQIGCTASDSIYLGDHERDIQAGRNANMYTIAAAYGYVGDKASIVDWQADYVANDVAAAFQKIKQLYIK